MSYWHLVLIIRSFQICNLKFFGAISNHKITKRAVNLSACLYTDNILTTNYQTHRVNAEYFQCSTLTDLVLAVKISKLQTG